MGFIIFNPLGERNPRIVKTTNKVVDQLWQELVLLRYMKGKGRINASKVTAPWIDQAKIYYLDAANSDWRSAGLLYYYSFLNLAKALLVVNRNFTYKALNTVSIYHGLRADLQDITDLPDFEIEIYPAQQNDRNNIFPYLYKVITKQDWPFSASITVHVKDFAAYCEDIGKEMTELFNIKQKIVRAQSLLRKEGNQVWFEMAVAADQRDMIKSHFPKWVLESVEPMQLERTDKADWLLAYQRPSSFFLHIDLLRSPKKVADDLDFALEAMSKEVIHYFKAYALPNFHEKSDSGIWDFCPRITLNAAEIIWHPLLSDYLMAFVLSAILRYQPQLLRIGTPNCFIAEGWCAQSALTALRCFLASFTTPPLHVEGC